MRRLAPILLWALAAGLAGRLPGQESAPAAPAAPVDEELARLNQNLSSIKEDESSVLGQLSRLELASRIGQRETQLLDSQVGSLKADADRQSAEAKRLEQEIAEDEQSIASIFSTAYRQRRKPFAGQALNYRSWLLYRRYGGFFARIDQGRITAYKLKVRDLAARRARLERQIRELRLVQSERNKKGRELGELRSRYRLLLTAVSRQKKAYTDGLQAMDNALKKLPADRVPRPPDGGALRWQAPLNAPVAVDYGHIVDPEYHTQLPHPGLDYNAAEGTPVRAAASGKVALAQFLEGYGETVIIEHDGNYLSIYAHLRKPLVAVDAAVERGALLGLVGDTGSLRGAYLYFEVRKNGAPVNPRTVIGAKSR